MSALQEQKSRHAIKIELISLHLGIKRLKYPPVFNTDKKYLLKFINTHSCKSHWTAEINILSVMRNTQER